MAGTLTLAEGEVRADGTPDGLSIAGEPVSGLPLVSDAGGETDDAGARCASPLPDRARGPDGRSHVGYQAAARREFEGIDHWAVDPAWRVEARFEATPGRTIRVPDVLGTDEDDESPGDVVFELDGVTHRLQALPGGDSGELWLVFGDATNGHETYGGGRFLYTGAPDANGRVTVDFNRAYNPPCVFSRFATCPLPWPANRLPIRVEAGERNWDSH